jgi:hydroxyacylglutathione hydrolase
MKILENLHAFIWQSTSANNCNSFLIDGPARVLIDPGHRELFGHVEQGLRELGLGVADIDLVICTHGHPDHLESIPLFKNGKTRVALHQTEWEWISTVGRQMAAAYGIDIDSFNPDFFLNEGELSINGLDFQVIHTPGHSPGSVCLYWPDHKALFTGDLVFKQGVGRTDLPGGNGDQLKDSIKNLTHLEVEYVLPGHGDIISSAGDVQANFTEIENYWFNYI